MAEKKFGGDSTLTAAQEALKKKRQEIGGTGARFTGGATVDPTSPTIETRGAEGPTPGDSGTKEEGEIEGSKDPSRVRKTEREAASELAADERRAEVEALGDKTAKKGAKKAEKELSKDVRGLKKETAKAERQDKKGAKEASYSTNEGAKAAVEDVAESVAGTVSGAAPAKTIKPAGRVEEMSLRQLRERERGAGVGGLLGTGGARGDVRRRMRQGTIQTEAGQEALGEFQEAREARQDAQQAKREARAVLRGGEYTPSGPGGFRQAAQEAAARATAASDVLAGAEEAEAKAPAKRTTPEQTGYRAPMDPARIEAGLEQTSPLDEPPRIEDEFGMSLDSESPDPLLEESERIEAGLEQTSPIQPRDESPEAEDEYQKDQFFRDVAGVENPVEIVVPDIMLDQTAPENQPEPSRGKKFGTDLESLLFHTHGGETFGTRAGIREDAFYALRDKLTTLIPDGVAVNPEHVAGLAVARIRMPEFTSGQVDINTLVGQAINEAIQEYNDMKSSPRGLSDMHTDPFRSDRADYKFHQDRLDRFKNQVRERTPLSHRQVPIRSSRD